MLLGLTLIFHLTKAEDWSQAKQAGTYRGDTLDDQGFIHCSIAKQVVSVANALYHDQVGLVLLCIDTERLGPSYESIGYQTENHIRTFMVLSTPLQSSGYYPSNQMPMVLFRFQRN